MSDHPEHSDNNKPRPSFYAIIPAFIRYDKEIEPRAILLYGELTALCEREGYCWASNAYFEGLYDVDETTIQRWLKSLKEKGYIRVDIEKKGMITKRKIWIDDRFQKISPTPQKCHPRHRKDEVVDTAKMPPISLHSNINTSSNVSISSSSTQDTRKIDDACGADDDFENIGENIWFRKTSGQMKKITQSEIYQHFLKHAFSTEMVTEAIERFKSLTIPINNPLKYLESICLTIDKEKADKPAKRQKTPIKQERPEKIKEQTITFGDYIKKCKTTPNSPSGKI